MDFRQCFRTLKDYENTMVMFLGRAPTFTGRIEPLAYNGNILEML